MTRTNTVAILGATSHIARGLIATFLRQEPATYLRLFARNPHGVESFLAGIGQSRSNRCITAAIEELAGDTYDVIINCIGVGTPAGVVQLGHKIVRITERFDALALGLLDARRETLYVSLSSGVVYGRDFSSPATAETEERIAPGRLDPADHYAIAKAESEARHRARPDLSIVDLRVFSYFSRWIDMNAGFLLTDILTAVRNGTTLTTGAEDVVRDYAHPSDLCRLIMCCAGRRQLNTALDVYSAAPVRKSEILAYFRETYGLRWETAAGNGLASPTGLKAHYYSLNHKAEALGFEPSMTSIECIAAESRAILGR